MNSQEPRNGDFVAYVERLQRESAARLRAGGSRTQIVELPNTPIASRDVPTWTPAPAPTPAREAVVEAKAPALSRQQADDLVDRLKGVARTAPSESRASAGPAIALVAGGLMIVHALVNNGGIVALIIGGGLVAWGFRRLRSLTAGNTAERLRRHAEYKQRVAQTFGKPPPS